METSPIEYWKDKLYEAKKRRYTEAINLVSVEFDGEIPDFVDMAMKLAAGLIQTKEELITILMELTFHHSDETTKPIVDSFIKIHPEMLNYFTLEYLYTI